MTKLAELRTAAGITQQELARQSGVKQGIISLIESGSTQFPRLDTAAKLARALGCTIDDLLGEKEGPNCPTERPNEGDAQNG